MSFFVDRHYFGINLVGQVLHHLLEDVRMHPPTVRNVVGGLKRP